MPLPLPPPQAGDVLCAPLEGFGLWLFLVLSHKQFARLRPTFYAKKAVVPVATLGDGKCLLFKPWRLRPPAVVKEQPKLTTKKYERLRQQAIKEMHERYVTWTYQLEGASEHAYHEYLCVVLECTPDVLRVAEIKYNEKKGTYVRNAETVPSEEWKRVEFVGEPPEWFPAYEPPERVQRGAQRGAQKGPVYGKRLTEEQTQALDDLQAKRRRRTGA